MEPAENRLREHPSERFAAAQHCFDLNEIGDQLESEAHPARKGHRQIAVYSQGAVTMVLFDFEAGGGLKDHAANGLVTIQVLQGAITVGTAQENYELSDGGMVVLNPNIVHSVQAAKASRMLLTVHLSDEKKSEESNV